MEKVKLSNEERRARLDEAAKRVQAHAHEFEVLGRGFALQVAQAALKIAQAHEEAHPDMRAPELAALAVQSFALAVLAATRLYQSAPGMSDLGRYGLEAVLAALRVEASGKLEQCKTDEDIRALARAEVAKGSAS